MPSLFDKRDKLFSEIESTLNAHRSGVQGHKHFRRLDQLQASRKARLDIMGDGSGTIWYFHVFPLSWVTEQESPAGPAQRTRHDFHVQVLYEWEDSDSYSGSTQETWEQMMFSTSSPIGLIEDLSDRSYVQTGGETTTIQPPQEMDGGDMFDIQQMDGEGREWAHIAEMRVPMLDPRA